MGVKVAVIGGASTYTPELIDGLAVLSERLPVDELVLEDIAADRLEIVGPCHSACSDGSRGRAG